jgi:hypothetical protein
MRWLAGMLLASGCLSSSSTTCTSGDLTWVCPDGYECAEVGAYCGLTVQVDACTGKQAFDSCSFTDQSTDTSGTCELGVCTACAASTEADLEGCTYAGWEAMDAPASPYLGVWDIGRADAYAVGTNALLHYDGKAWGTPAGLPDLGPMPSLNGVWASATNDVYVAASAVPGGDLLHFDGAAWMLMPGGDSSETLAAVTGVSDHDVYAAGSHISAGVKGVVRHFDGTTWTSIDVGTKQLTGMWASATRQVAVGNGLGVGILWRTDDTGTFVDETPASPSPMPILTGVWGSADNDIYVVGNISGAQVPTILHYDGSGWTPVPQCPQGDPTATACFEAGVGQIALLGIWGRAANDIYAVGDSGAIVHFDGQRWGADPATTPPGATLTAISGLANETIVVGNQVIWRKTTP